MLVVQDDDSTSPVEVARWLQERLEGWPENDVVLVGVVAGELFDNAVNHGLPPYVLKLDLDEFGESMVVSVRNHARRRVGPWQLSAGLLLIDALSSRWGILTQNTTTTVWARLDFED